MKTINMIPENLNQTFRTPLGVVCWVGAWCVSVLMASGTIALVYWLARKVGGF